MWGLATARKPGVNRNAWFLFRRFGSVGDVCIHVLALSTPEAGAWIIVGGSLESPVLGRKPRKRTPLSRVILWERCPKLRIGYFPGLLWLVCIGLQQFASVNINQH